MEKKPDSNLPVWVDGSDSFQRVRRSAAHRGPALGRLTFEGAIGDGTVLRLLDELGLNRRRVNSLVMKEFLHFFGNASVFRQITAMNVGC